MVLLASFSSVMSVIGSVAVAILILLLMITVHELGHYIAGKLLKFKINEFSIGFGPALFKKQGKNELFAVRLIPLGGYCAFAGEDEDVGADNPDAFNNKKPWQRIIVLLSGVFMNFVFALLVIIISFFAYGQFLLVTHKLAPVEDAAISAEHCFQADDIIIKADGKNVYNVVELISAVKGKQKYDKVPFTVSRVDEGSSSRKTIEVQIMLRADGEVENLTDTDAVWACLGIAGELQEDGSVKYQMYKTDYKFGFFETIGRAFEYTVSMGGTVFKVLGELLTGALGLSAIGGPITTIKMTTQMASMGFQYVLEITGLIGVNLAVMNLLPIPALDGARVVFCIIEWIRRKPVNRKVEALIHAVGLVFLFGFSILVDILQLF